LRADWITANTSKGVKLQSYSIEQLAVRVTGDIAINHYRIKANWGTGETDKVRTDALRITHTWIRTHGTWQILGGMSAPVNASGK
jgi:ketosteroid isomerase-like protein